MAKHTFAFKALPGVTFEMTPPGLTSYTVTANGAPVKKRLGGFELVHDGQPIKVRTRATLNPFAPIFEYHGERVQPGPPSAPTWLLLVALLPIGLVAVGGAIGGALGAGGWMANVALINRVSSPLTGLLICLAVSGAAVGLWYVLARAIAGG